MYFFEIIVYIIFSPHTESDTENTVAKLFSFEPTFDTDTSRSNVNTFYAIRYVSVNSNTEPTPGSTPIDSFIFCQWVYSFFSDAPP